MVLREFNRGKRYKDASLRQAVYRLRKRGYVAIREQNGKTVIELTRAGNRIALKYRVEDMKLSRPKRWDGLWRLVFFDIPEKEKRAREVFRTKLNELGFYQIQKSVYVHPYPCEKELVFLRELYHLSPYIHLAVARTLERRGALRRRFQI